MMIVMVDEFVDLYTLKHRVLFNAVINQIIKMLDKLYGNIFRIVFV